MDQPPSLQRVALRGFRSIREMDLELGPLNVLIGANGAGKSNFISFFRFMNKLQDKDLQFYAQQQGGADRILHFGRKTTDTLEIELRFSLNGYAAVLAPTPDNRLVFRDEFHAPPGLKPPAKGGNGAYRKRRTRLGRTGAEESALPKPDITTERGRLAAFLADWKTYHFHDTSDTAKVKGTCSVHDTTRLRSQGENLAAFLYGIRNTDAYARIVRTVQRVAPFFHDFVLDPDGSDWIRLRWKHKGSDDYFDASMLSDGTLRFICLATLLLQPRLPTIILLDEPELGLHPYALQLLGAMMRMASTRTQIVATTQSVTLANEFGWQDIVVVDQIDNASRFRRLEEQAVGHWLEDYRVGEIWEMNLLGGNPA
ncbi:AAA family ATPase [Aromatoleum anaerobium]|uniref:AAA family ATPase n=1 Tax=Aromatoleum anaerobium TaxID=182180 RepID=A0ABX1PRW7_9RHOO|nr:AAA family ATPase [Aromatoleum anaerobium]MCK0508725.1 AAA family ATPase [Aromatoleum anaerobium]